MHYADARPKKHEFLSESGPTEVVHSLYYLPTMATFFFRFCSGRSIEQDPHGIELPDLDAAREEALQAAREIVSNAIRFGSDDLPDDIMIVDLDDSCLAIVPIADALPRRLRR